MIYHTVMQWLLNKSCLINLISIKDHEKYNKDNFFKKVHLNDKSLKYIAICQHIKLPNKGHLNSIAVQVSCCYFSHFLSTTFYFSKSWIAGVYFFNKKIYMYTSWNLTFVDIFLFSDCNSQLFHFSLSLTFPNLRCVVLFFK